MDIRQSVLSTIADVVQQDCWLTFSEMKSICQNKLEALPSHAREKNNSKRIKWDHAISSWKQDTLTIGNYTYFPILDSDQDYQGYTRQKMSPQAVCWFKCVTRADGKPAYVDDDLHFILHFPNTQKGNVLSPAVGDIIILYQQVKSKKFLSHLVTPIDSDLVETKRTDYKWGRRMIKLAQTEPEAATPLSKTVFREISLRGVCQGNACELSKIKSIQNKLETVQTETWRTFEGKFTQSFSTLGEEYIRYLKNIEYDGFENDKKGVTEGRTSLVTHMARERNQKIVRDKKQEALMNNRLHCEVCDFSFIKKFDQEFIECHHISPISDGGIRTTTLDDLALVCANCHRMLHRQFNGEYLSVQELRALIP